MLLALRGAIGIRLRWSCLLLPLLLPFIARHVQAAPRDWTILVYMAADNDLERFGVDDLNEIEAGLPVGDRVEVLAMVDRAKGYDKREGDWTGGRYYRIRPDPDRAVLHSEVIQELGEVNTGDPATLARAVGWAFKSYPASHTALVMWDHGNGWSQMALDEDVPDAPGSEDFLTLSEMAVGLRRGLAEAGLAKLDIVGFDMCLMAQLETAFEFQDMAGLLVSSQAVEPGEGWPYDQILPMLARENVQPRALADKIVQEYATFYAQRPDRATTMSLVDLGKMPAVIAAADQTWAALTPGLDQDWAEVSRALFWSVGFSPSGKISDLRRGPRGLNSIDLIDAVTRLRANLGAGFAAMAEAQTLDAALREAVLTNAATGTFSKANGLAVYAPIRGAAVDPDYAQTRLAKESGWLPFLTKLHQAQKAAARPPEINRIEIADFATKAAVANVAPLDDAVLSVEVKGDNILTVTTVIGRQDPTVGGVVAEQVGFLIDGASAMERAKDASDLVEWLSPVYAPGGARLSVDLPGIVPIVGSGGVLAQPTIESADIDAQGQPWIKARANVQTRDGQQFLAVVSFDLKSMQAITLTALIPGPDGRVQPRDLEPQPDDQLSFLALVLMPDGSTRDVPAGAAMPWGNGPEIMWDLARPGKYQLNVRADTIGGEIGRAIHEFSVVPPSDITLSMIHGAKELTAARLAGDWLLEGQPFAHFAAIPDQPDVLAVTYADPAFGQQLADKGIARTVAWVDLRRMPSLAISQLDRRGRIQSSQQLLMLAAPGQNNRLLVRSFIGVEGDPRGQTYSLERVGTAVAQEQAAPTAPAPVPMPPSPPPAPAQPPAPVVAAQPTVQQFGPLAGLLRASDDPPWKVGFEANGGFFAENPTDETSIRFVYVPDQAVTPPAPRRISTTLVLPPGGTGRAGLAAVLPGDRELFAMLERDGTLSVLVLAGGELTSIQEWTLLGFDPAQPHAVLLVDRGGILELSLDGRALGKIAAPGRLGQIGIAAYGLGKAVFERFEVVAADGTLVPLAAPPAAPQPQVAPPPAPVPAPPPVISQPPPIQPPAPPPPAPQAFPQPPPFPQQQPPPTAYPQAQPQPYPQPGQPPQGQFPQQSGQFPPQQPQAFPQPAPFPPQAPYPQQPAPYPQAQPQPYPQQGGFPLGQPGQFPQQPGQFPQAQPYPGLPPFPGQPPIPGQPSYGQQGIDPSWLVGDWRGFNQNGSSIALRLDGQANFYQVETAPTGQSVQISGRWQLQGNLLAIQVGQVFPQQICTPGQGCMPVNVPPFIQVPIELREGGMLLLTPVAQLRRAQ